MGITITLTPDELANLQTAVEHHLDYLSDWFEMSDHIRDMTEAKA